MKKIIVLSCVALMCVSLLCAGYVMSQSEEENSAKTITKGVITEIVDAPIPQIKVMDGKSEIAINFAGECVSAKNGDERAISSLEVGHVLDITYHPGPDMNMATSVTIMKEPTAKK